jgi:hypothetical protein
VRPLDSSTSGPCHPDVLFAAIFLASTAGVSGFLVVTLFCLYGVVVADFHFISCSGHHTEDSESMESKVKPSA